ncbi:hypothetical protein EJ07DRAFT_155329 [Lizonia empirigonia]|nr:hypothetical protein EJ07DRAFT_155329 [Lizonia empirigonia]
MPPARPRAESLSISIPATALWRLCRPPTPRRATYPLPSRHDAPPIPPLSFWIPDTPSPIPKSVPPSAESLTSNTSSPLSCYSQPSHAALTLQLAQATCTPQPTKLLTPVSPYSPHSPTSPYYPLFPYSSISPTSPQSPDNPYLSPPLPRFAASPLAAPLLPASPLSIFDRAVSPTSPTFLLSRTPSPITPMAATFLRAATPSTNGEGWGPLSPTFLCPRAAPGVPSGPSASLFYAESGGWERKERRGDVNEVPGLNDNGDGVQATDAGRMEMKKRFFHFLAARRAAALDRCSGLSSTLLASTSRLAGAWRRLVPKVTVREIERLPSRHNRFSLRGGFGHRA